MSRMPKGRRLDEQAREVIASILMDEISDPRLSLVTVTGTKVSPDRSTANVYVIAAPDAYEDVLAGLESAKGRIRSLLGHALSWRVTPELRFFIDPSVDEGMRISEALKHVPPTLLIEREDAEQPESDEDED